MDREVNHQMSQLLSLAHDKTESGRLVLAEKLVDVFFSDTIALSKREEQLVNNLIDDLLKNEQTSVRHMLINHFTESIDLPRHIALRVANGPIDIAANLLKENVNLKDDDLIMIVERKGIFHAQAIAHRYEISEVVADALIETGDLRVMQIVAENLGAKLSVRSLEILVESARLSALLQKPILERAELNRESASHLYWWASHDLRRATLERFGFGPGKLDEELSKAIEEMLSVNILQKDDNEVMGHLADWLSDRGALGINNLTQFLRAGHFKLFHIALSRLTKLDLSLVDTIAREKDGRMMVALCRAIGIDKGKFISIFLMARSGLNDEHIVHPRELSGVLETFERLTQEIAQSMLETWRITPPLISENKEIAETGDKQKIYG